MPKPWKSHHHDKHDTVPLSEPSDFEEEGEELDDDLETAWGAAKEYLQLKKDLQEVQEDHDDAVENLNLARVSARTLEEQFRSEQRDIVRLKAALAASEASSSEFEAQLMDASRERQQVEASVMELADAHQRALEEVTVQSSSSRATVAQKEAAEAEVLSLRKELVSSREAERQLRVASNEEGQQNGKLRSSLDEAELAAVDAAAEQASQEAEICGLREKLLTSTRIIVEQPGLCNADMSDVPVDADHLHSELQERDAVVEELRACLAKADLQGREADVSDVTEVICKVEAAYSTCLEELQANELQVSELTLASEELGVQLARSSEEHQSKSERLGFLEELREQGEAMFDCAGKAATPSFPSSPESRQGRYEDEGREQHEFDTDLRLSMEEAIRAKEEANQRAKEKERRLQSCALPQADESPVTELKERLCEVEAAYGACFEKLQETELEVSKLSLHSEELGAQVARSAQEHESQEERLSFLEEELCQRHETLADELRKPANASSRSSSSDSRRRRLEDECREQDSLLRDLRLSLEEALHARDEEEQRAEKRAEDAEFKLRSCTLAEAGDVEAKDVSDPDEVESLHAQLRKHSTALEEATEELEQSVEWMGMLEADLQERTHRTFQLCHAQQVQPNDFDQLQQLQCELREREDALLALQEKFLKQDPFQASDLAERLQDLEDELRQRDSTLLSLQTNLAEAGESAQLVQDLQAELRARDKELQLQQEEAAMEPARGAGESLATRLRGATELCDQFQETEADATVENMHELQLELRERDRDVQEMRAATLIHAEATNTSDKVLPDADAELRLPKEQEDVVQEQPNELSEDEAPAPSSSSSSSSSAQLEECRADPASMPQGGPTTEEVQHLEDELRRRDEKVQALQDQLTQVDSSRQHGTSSRSSSSEPPQRAADPELLSRCEQELNDRDEAVSELRQQCERATCEESQILLQQTEERELQAALARSAEAAKSLQAELTEDLQRQLAGERQVKADMEQALQSCKEEAFQLTEQLEDKEYALLITSEAAAEQIGDDDFGPEGAREPVGVREARRLRAECLQLQAELKKAEEEPRGDCKQTRSPEGPRIHSKGTCTFGEASEEGMGSQASGRLVLPDVAGMPSARTDSQADAEDTNPFGSAGNPFGGEEEEAHTPSELMRPSPSFGSRGVEAALEANSSQFWSPSLSHMQPRASSPSFAESPMLMHELADLRAELNSEELACSKAREEALGAQEALREGIKGKSAESEDIHRLRQALSEESAKSRRLGEHAMRAEESRRRLLHELAEGATADADLLALAKVLGRAAKAISTITKEAPLLPPDDPPPRPEAHTGHRAAVAVPTITVEPPQSPKAALPAAFAPPRRLPAAPVPKVHGISALPAPPPSATAAPSPEDFM